MSKIVGILVVIIILVVAVGTGVYYYFSKPKSSEPVACTMEAKQCPDGSYVGRAGPKCEFAPCPSEAENR